MEQSLPAVHKKYRIATAVKCHGAQIVQEMITTNTKSVESFLTDDQGNYFRLTVELLKVQEAVS